MRRISAALIAIIALAGAYLYHKGQNNAPWVDASATAQQPTDTEQSGYLLLAVSWTPSWCAAEGTARGADRCRIGAGAGWLVHGLWPQFDDGGWPEFCDTAHSPPSRAQTAAMIDIMGSDGLALHQWRKHGSCSGMSAGAYFETTRAAFASLTMPDKISATQDRLRMSPAGLLAAFRAANPAIGEDMAILTCRDGMAQEIRLCLNHDLTPRRCDLRLLSRGCRARKIALPAQP